MSGEKKVAVVTESIASLTPKEVAALEVTVIPVPFSYAGRSYLDGVDITPEEFYAMMSTELPAAETSAPSPGAYMETFSGLLRSGYEVLCITATARIVRMHEAATMGERLAREDGAEGRIEIFDSGTAAMGQGFLVLEAARMAVEGAAMAEILGRVRRLSESVYLLATLDTLDYLAKTSRIPGISALFGKVLQIKPVVLFAHGNAEPLEKPRSRRRAKRRLFSLMADRLRGGLPLHVAVQHAAAPEEAEELKEVVAENLRPRDLSVHEFSPVMASYTGPGFLGLAFYEDPDPHEADARGG